MKNEHHSKKPASGKATNLKATLKRKLREAKQQRYLLRLYVTGVTRASRHAIERVHEACMRELKARYDLEVIDIYKHPALAKGEQIVATPTLIQVLPAPLRRYIGNMSNQNIIFGLDLVENRKEIAEDDAFLAQRLPPQRRAA